MSEYASSKLKRLFKTNIRSISWNSKRCLWIFAAITVAPFCGSKLQVFGIEATFNSALASGIVMGIMIIPTIFTI